MCQNISRDVRVPRQSSVVNRLQLDSFENRTERATTEAFSLLEGEPVYIDDSGYENVVNVKKKMGSGG